MSSMEVSNLSIDALIKMFSEGKRFDGRSLTDCRAFSIEYDVSVNAEGSARVRMGKTDVVVGVKLSLGTPYPDSPDKGNLMVSGDLLPLASPRFEQGPPEFNAIELSRLIDRAIRESGMIQLDKLVVKAGEKVWTVIIDIYPLNDDGNLIDAASIATVAALKSTILPGIDESGKVDYKHRTKTKLPLAKDTAPISFSFFKLGDFLVMDPTREEEEACESRITWGISKYGKDYMINSCQKAGKMPMKKDEIEKMMPIIEKKFDEINEKLKKFL